MTEIGAQKRDFSSELISEYLSSHAGCSVIYVL